MKDSQKTDFKTIFQKELTQCLLSFKGLGEKENLGQYKIICNQFLDCISKFENQLDRTFFIEKLVEFGESLLEIRSFHYFADRVCFQKANHLINLLTETNQLSRLKDRIFYGQCILDYLIIAESNFGFQAKGTETKVHGIIERMRKRAQGNADSAILYTIYHSIQMVRLATIQNKAFQVFDFNKVPDMNWILETDLARFEKDTLAIKMRITLDLLEIYSLSRDMTRTEALLSSSLLWLDHAESKACKRAIQSRASGLLLQKYFNDGTKLLNSLPVGSHEYYQEHTWAELIARIVSSTWGLFQKQVIYLYKLEKLPEPFRRTTKRIEQAYEQISTFLDNHNINLESDAMQLEFSNEPIVPEVVEKEEVKGKKKVPKEDEDFKWKKEILLDLQAFFAPFAAVEKFGVLVQGLKLISLKPNRIKFADKQNEQKDFLVQTLIEMADALVSHGTLPKEKRQHFEKELDDQVYPLENQDLIDFSNILFQYKQWKRLNIILVYTQKRNLKGKEFHRLMLHYSLLIVSAKFIVSQQNDRKVSFESNLAGRTTPTDIRITMFDLTDQMKSNMSMLCKVILDCLQDNHFLEYHAEMVLDSTLLIWSFMEPFLRTLTSPNEPNYLSGLKEDDLLLSVLDFLHCVFTSSRIVVQPNHCITGIGISQKLALVHECLELFTKSCQVLEESFTNIEWIRQHCFGAAPIDYASADIDFLHQEGTKAEPDTFQKYRKMFGCIHTDVQNAWYRCRIKSFQRKQDEDMKQRQLEVLKLRHVLVDIPRQLVHKDDQRLREWCGSDPVKRALFSLSVIQHAERISVEEKNRLLTLAKNYLIEAKEMELHSFSRMLNKHSLGIDILRRSTHSVIVQVCKHEKEKNVALDCKLVKSRADCHASDACGIGIKMVHFAEKNIMLTSGYIPNEKYIMYSVHETDQGTQKTEPVPIVTALPLSLPLCWSYLYGIALEYDVSIAEFARKVLEDHLILSKCSDDVLLTSKPPSATNFDPPQLFLLKSDNVINTDPCIVRGYTHALFHSLELEEQQFIKSDKSKNILLSQLLKLRICRDLLVAADCAMETNNDSLELLCAIRVFDKLQAFLKSDAISPIVIYMLYRCHQTLIRVPGGFKDDRPKGLKDYLVAITFHLVQYLVRNANINLAIQIASDSATLIHVTAHTIDNRILNSTHFESNLLGYSYKPQKGKAKRGSSQYLLEFGFHGLLAVTKTPKLGLTLSRKQFDVFYEEMELILAKSKTSVNLLDPAQKKSVVINRKTLDNSTCLRELYHLFSTSGPESTLQELAKYKKNSRYIELVSELVAWCLEKENMESAVKIVNEIEDWVDKRSQVMLRMDELMEDSISQKKDIILKRRRRPLFALDKTIQMDSIKGRYEPRGREPEHKSKSEPRNVSKQMSKETSKSSPDKYRTTSSRPTSVERTETSRSFSRDRNGSASGSVSRGHSTSPIPAASESSDSASLAQAQKKKKSHNRHVIFSGLSQADKEKTDHAVRVLDKQLYHLWHKRRYARRLRALFEYENPHRSKLLLLKAKSLFCNIQKDSKVQSPVVSVDTEWFHLNKSGGLLWSKMYPTDGSLQSLETYQAQHVNLIEMMQCFVQSIVLASRSGDHIKVIQNSKAFWNCLCYLFHVGKLENAYWNQMLWRGMLSVGQAMLDSLKAIKYIKAEKNEYLDFEIEPKDSIPVSNVGELYSCKVYGVWTDKYMMKQIYEIDLAFCAEFLLFILQTLHVSRKTYRTASFGKKILSLFNNIHEPIITPILQGAEDMQVGVRNTKSAVDMRTRCRYLLSLSILESVRGAKSNIPQRSEEIVKLYSEAISLAKESKDFFLTSTLCNELGDFLYDSGRNDGATVYWSLAIDHLLGQSNAIKTIVQVLQFEWKTPNHIHAITRLQTKAFGIYGNMLLVHIVTKLCRFVYQSNYDKQSQLVWLASEIIFLTLKSHLGNPETYLDYQQFCANSFLKKHDLFRDKFMINATLFFSNLVYLASQAIEKGHPVMAFPVLAIADNISYAVLHSVAQNNVASLLKVEALAKTGFVKEAFKLYSHCSKRLNFRKKMEEEISYENHVFPLTYANAQSIKTLLAITLSDKLRSHMPFQVVQRFDLVKIQVVLDILQIQQTHQITSFPNGDAAQFESTMLDLFVDMRCVLWKLVGTLQTAIKKDEAIPESDQHVTSQCLMLETIHTLSLVCYSQRKYKCSLRWSLVIQKHLENLQSKPVHALIMSALGPKFVFKNLVQTVKSALAENENQMALEKLNELDQLLGSCKVKSLQAEMLLFKVEAIQAVGYEKSVVLSELNHAIDNLEEIPFSLELISRLHQVVGVITLGLQWNSVPTQNILSAVSHCEKSLQYHTTCELMYSITQPAHLLQNRIYQHRLLAAKILANHKSIEYNQLESLLSTCYSLLFDNIPSVCGLLTSLDQFILGSLCFQLRMSTKDTLFLDYCQKILHMHLSHLKECVLQEYQRIRVVNQMLLTIEIEKNNLDVSFDILKHSVDTKLGQEVIPLTQDSFTLQEIPPVVAWGMNSKSKIQWILNDVESFDVNRIDESSVLDKNNMIANASVTEKELKEIKTAIEVELMLEKTIWYCERNLNIAYQQKRLRQFFCEKTADVAEEAGSKECILLGWLYQPKQESQYNLNPEVIEYLIQLNSTTLNDILPQDAAFTNGMVQGKSRRTMVVMTNQTEQKHIIRNVPKNVLTILRYLIGSVIDLLRYHEMTNEDVFLKQASDNWTITIQAISRILSNKNNDSLNSIPVISLSSAMVLCEIFDANEYCGSTLSKDDLFHWMSLEIQ